MFFIGWLLSPLTTWNDFFINIPLSYVLANVFNRLFPCNFLIAVLIFYWLTNALGLAMMYLSGRELFRDKERVHIELLKLFATVIVYSIALTLK